LAWPSGTAAHPAHASQCGFAGGLGVARPVGTPRGSDGGCAGQAGAAGFSPERADDDGVEKMAQHGGVPMQRRSSGGRGGGRRVLQLEEGTGEVRRNPKGADDGSVVELIEGGGQWHGGGSLVG
jgi:hypothetical protein